MQQEAGAEAAGLRGELLPTKGGLMLVRDATLSRDAANILLQAVASSLRSTDPPRILVVVAAHYCPQSYIAGLRRLGVSRSVLNRAVVIVDAQADYVQEDDEIAHDESNPDGNIVRVSSGEELQRVVEEQIGEDGTGALVMLDSADALKSGLRCDVDNLLRSALAIGAGFAVSADLDLVDVGHNGGLDLPHVLMEELSDSIADVFPLTDATEYGGRVTLQKVHGLWRRRPASDNSLLDGSFLYNIHDTAVRFYR